MNPPVHWHEGLFLQPHHLQWSQHQAGEGVVSRRKLAFSYPWGVVEAKLSGDALENMLVRFDKLRVVMPSGREVCVPEDADLPPLDIKKEFEGSTRPFTIDIGVPLWYPTRGNTIEHGSSADWRDKRLFRVAEVQRPDENTGENPQPVQVRRINARLMLPNDDRTDMEVVPVVRIMHGAGSATGKPRPEPTFIPPCMVLGGSPDLKNLVRDLANQVDATRKEMLIQLTRGGFSMEGLRGIQFEQLLRLRSVSRMASPLAELVKAPATTPLEAYLALRELLGELAALKPDRPEMYDVAAYDHANPGVCFRELNDRMRALLVGSVRDSFQKVEFKREGDILVAALSDDHLNLPNEYFLGIKTGTDPRAVAALVEDADQFKLMAKSMVQRNIFGVKLVEERHPPTVLPAQAGLHYYRLNRHESERMWGRVKEEKEVALRWPGLESSDFQCALYMPIPESK